MARVPNHLFSVDEDKCFGCGACIALCPVNALDLQKRLAVVDEKNCTHCELCIPGVGSGWVPYTGYGFQTPSKKTNMTRIL